MKKDIIYISLSQSLSMFITEFSFEITDSFQWEVLKSFINHKLKKKKSSQEAV